MSLSSVMQRTFWPAVGLLIAALIIFDLIPIDLTIQGHFFNQVTGAWVVDSKAVLPRLLFYTAPKALLLVFGVSILVVCFTPACIFRSILRDETSKRRWMIVVACLASAPLFISTLKAVTHVFCPYELARYGGDHGYQPVFQPYRDNDKPGKFGRGFPAGHASGGFALLSLAGLGRTRRGVLLGVVAGLFAGGMMGGYQILKGAHFVSHTIISGLICWIIFLLWHRLLLPRKSENSVTNPETGAILQPSE